ncbi:hypothetical protein [Allokutzneria sp. NRRL B-24872]|uniref:hypothetical protein n=1 Tax=Allokutzneria sp. NRRL B-24872 TaxID=1137961 RepID=UPI0011782347|nr:hypothetical protein [Allokutzneria sp. NRRL B-24872]
MESGRIRRVLLGIVSVVLLTCSVATGSAAATSQIPVETPPAGAAPQKVAPSGDVSKMLCAGHPPEYGKWVNADPNATGIARTELQDCLSVTVCEGSVCHIVHDAGWAMRVFGKCSPTNCDWGWSNSEFRMSSGHIHGFYDHGFAKRHVYAKMSQYRPGQLWVFWRTDFVDPARPDYEVQEWFYRV